MIKNKPSVNKMEEFPLARYLTAASKLYVGAIRKRFEQLDIDRHFSVLILLENSANSCTQQYIADYLQKDKTTMVSIIDSLVEKGYIKRVKNPKDRREHIIELTSKARKILPEIKKGINEMNLKSTKGLGKKEVNNFYKTLKVITDNLSNESAIVVDVSFEKIKNN